MRAKTWVKHAVARKLRNWIADLNETENRRLLDRDPHVDGRPVIRAYRPEGTVKIGAYSSVNNQSAVLLGESHRADWVTTYRLHWWLGVPESPGADPESFGRGDVTVGSDVWVGHEAVILSGVTIGHGAVIAARAVVTKDVEPYAIVGGTPAKLLRYRFAPDVIESLLEIAWWDWPEEKVRANIDLLSSPDVSEFIRVHGGD